MNIPGSTEVVGNIDAKIGGYGGDDTVSGSRHKRQFDGSLESGKNTNNNTKPRKQRHCLI
jgi:hypothetical protein